MGPPPQATLELWASFVLTKVRRRFTKEAQSCLRRRLGH